MASRQDHPNRGAGLESKQTLSKHDKRKLRSNVVILRDAPRRRRIMSLDGIRDPVPLGMVRIDY